MERYRSGYQAVVDALDRITPEELDRQDDSGEWSPRVVVHHLADSEATALVRLRRLIAEDSPVIQGYNEADYARRLHYDRPLEPSLAVVAAVRASSLQLLEHLTPEEWDLAGTHSESGSYSVDDWLRIYAGHAHDHANQIREARSG